MPLFAAPCLSGDGFEWRASERKVFVEGGEHTLRVYALDDGAKIRNVRFGERGSCGFTDSMPQDPAVVEYQTALCQHRLAGLGGVCPSTGAAVPGLEISLPDVCYSDCAGKSLCHFILQVIFLPRHPRRPAHSLVTYLRTAVAQWCGWRAGDFVEFHAECRQLLEADGVPGAGLRALDAFLDSCNAAPPPPPDAGALTDAECTAQFAGITDACCQPAKVCRSGVPSRCVDSCADPYLALYRDCRSTLQVSQYLLEL